MVGIFQTLVLSFYLAVFSSIFHVYLGYAYLLVNKMFLLLIKKKISDSGVCGWQHDNIGKLASMSLVVDSLTRII